MGIYKWQKKKKQPKTHPRQSMNKLIDDGLTCWLFLVLKNNPCPIPIGFFTVSCRQSRQLRKCFRMHLLLSSVCFKTWFSFSFLKNLRNFAPPIGKLRIINFHENEKSPVSYPRWVSAYETGRFCKWWNKKCQPCDIPLRFTLNFGICRIGRTTLRQ